MRSAIFGRDPAVPPFLAIGLAFVIVAAFAFGFRLADMYSPKATLTVCEFPSSEAILDSLIMETQVIIEPDKGSAGSVVNWLTSIGVQANVNDVVGTPEGNRSLITSIPFSDLTGLSEIPGVLEVKAGSCP